MYIWIKAVTEAEEETSQKNHNQKYLARSSLWKTSEGLSLFSNLTDSWKGTTTMGNKNNSNKNNNNKTSIHTNKKQTIKKQT